MSEVLRAVRERRSWSKVTPAAPSHDELLPLVQAAGRVADHSSLRPWRLIEIRGEARERVGAALAEAAGDKKPSHKPLRAPLLIAIVFSPTTSRKVAHWEQEAVASGVAHTLSLLLADAGWGVIWRTGQHTRADAVREAHKLATGETLLGWLYVGGVAPDAKVGSRKMINPEEFLSLL